jgi:hypothetical protein
VAAAVAAAFTQNAVAAVDIDDTTNPQQITFASEVVTPVAGFVAVSNAGALDADVTAGFSITSGTSKYMRFDITNATFGANLAAGDLTIAAGVSAAPVGTVLTDLSNSGATGDSFAIFEVEVNGGVVPSDAVATLSASAYSISATATSQICYSFYETALQALANDTTQALKSKCQDFAALGSAYSGVFAKGIDQIATVATDFKKFKDQDPLAAVDDTLDYGTVGVIDATGNPPTVTSSSILVPNVVDASGSAVTSTVLINATLTSPAVEQVVRVDGDFSFGTWSLDTADSCDSSGAGTVPITADTTKLFGVTGDVTTADLVSAPWYVCVNVDGTTEIIKKDDYSITLVDSALTNTLGTIKYDTTSIEVPYLTTFNEYKQRIYLINKGTADAEYSMRFITEDGITATDGPKATGVVPAGKMLMINAAEAVTLTGGKTRTAATIDVEGVDAKIQAAVQSVNLETGDTDTVVLNANSITSPTL